MEANTGNHHGISHVHLGTSGCKAALLNSFLESHGCEQLYLVGDIIDGWRIYDYDGVGPAAGQRGAVEAEGG